MPAATVRRGKPRNPRIPDRRQVSGRATADPASVAAQLAAARARLAGQPAGGLEAGLLLAEVLGVNRAWLFANPDHPLDPAQAVAFGELLGRRERGEPVAYLLGRREFWSVSLIVTPEVLIPRPETELLVQAALEFIPDEAAWRVADLGTGSGAVALAIARERLNCEIHATDVSAAALKVASMNVDRLAPGRVHLHHGEWLEPLAGRFRVIVSNPPYVAENDPHLDQGDCRFEPRTALTAGPDGMAAIARIARDALPRLEPGGLLALEHGFEQAAAVRGLLEDGGYGEIRTLPDLEGRDRVTLGCA